MRKNLLLILFVALLIIPQVLANEEFIIETQGGEETLCPTHTTSISIPVKNTGQIFGSYSVSLAGTARNWAVAAPTGFTLNPGNTRIVYVWITPPSKTLPGEYTLVVSVDGNTAGTKQIEYLINVESCHNVQIYTVESSKNSCPGKLTTYQFTIENTGIYTEDYILSTEGSAKNWATLSKRTLKLVPEGSETIQVYIKSPLNEIGTFDFSLTAESKYSDAIATKNAEIILESCYDYSIRSAKEVYSFCDNTHAKIPILIKNEGLETNTINLNVEGTSWVTLENKQVTLEEGESKEINLVIFPTYYVTGEYPIRITGVGEVGALLVDYELMLQIRSCFVTNLDISLNKDAICEQAIKSYEVSLTNAGEYSQPYSVYIDGPSWATLDKSFVELESGESEQILLSVSAPQEPGEYEIKVIAQSQQPSQTSGEDTLFLEIISKEICFSIDVSAELNEIDIARGEGALLPITISNNGQEEAVYELEVFGAGASFAQLTPGTLKVKPGTFEIANLYIAIPYEAEQEKYILSVFAKILDGILSDSDTITIHVVKSGEGIVEVDHIPPKDAQTVEDINETEKVGFFTRLSESAGKIISSITGRVVSTDDEKSFSILDNWKYIVGIIILLLIILLLWFGFKSEDDYEEISKEMNPEDSNKEDKESEIQETTKEEKTSKSKDISEEKSSESKEILKEDKTPNKEDSEKSDNLTSNKKDEESSKDSFKTEKQKNKQKKAIVDKIKKLLEEDE